jgi:hypothetical protein
MRHERRHLDGRYYAPSVRDSHLPARAPASRVGIPRREVPEVGNERPDDVLDKRTLTLWCQQPAIHLRFSLAYAEAREDARSCAMGALQGADVALCAPT